jgi:glycerophosphoryl diester phosphodiesterase
MRKTLATLAVALVGSLLSAVPAEAHHARPGDHVLGHRCRTYDAAVTNENTVAALVDTAGVPGAICEIDAVKIADGTVIVWHDATWNRVANPATLPAGISRTSPVKQATWAQVSRIRTKGGQPVARLQDMIDAAASYNIALAVDLRNAMPNPAALVAYARDRGADVSYYQLVQSGCSTRNIDGFRAAGAKVGIKLLGACPMTPAQLQAKGASFTQELSFRLTDPYLVEMKSRGITVGVLDRGMTEATAAALIDRGVSRVLLDRPRDALNWFD